MISQYLFFFLSFLAILSALMVIFSKNPVHSILYLIITFFAIAGHYFLLNAQFLAAVHIIVYAGAIMVLFLYAIMMLNLNKETESNKHPLTRIAAVLTGGIFMLVLVAALKNTEEVIMHSSGNKGIGLVENLGKTLFGEYLLPFEVSSILFLSAMVGAVFLSKKEIH
ncbi:MAG: NADH-quinone oxidoreductase subunit J [Saprospiraceae bacterium]